MTKARTALNRIIHWITKERLPEFIIFGVVGTVMYFSVAAYYIKYMGNFAENSGYNFEMAMLSATLGGFVLIGGFLNKTSPTVNKDLINSAKGFLTSAVFSTIFVFTLPMGAVTKPDQALAYYLLIFVLIVSMMITVLGFTWGVSVLIPCLWKIGRKSWMPTYKTYCLVDQSYRFNKCINKKVAKPPILFKICRCKCIINC